MAKKRVSPIGTKVADHIEELKTNPEFVREFEREGNTFQAAVASALHDLSAVFPEAERVRLQ